MSRPLVSALAITTTALALSGCYTDCTLIGCVNSLSVDVRALADEPGEYTLTLEGDVERTCTFVVDESRELVTDGFGPECSGSDTGGSRWISFWVGAGEYTVTLSDELGELGSAEVSLDDFEAYYPNGERCEPGCEEASVELSSNGAG